MSHSMKVSITQILWLMFSMEIGMTLLLTISSAIREAKQDAWLSIIVAMIGSFVIAIIAIRLNLLYPNQTLVEFSQSILGKWIGKMIVIPYFVMWYSVIGIILRQSSDFIHLALFRRTPLWAILILAVIMMVYSVYRGGIEGVGRCSELMGPFIIFALSIVILLCLHNMKFVRLFPVYYDSGWYAILKGSISPMSFLGEVTMMTMLFSFVTKPQKVLLYTIIGVGLASLYVLIATIGIFLTFDGLAGKMWYPFFDMARFISVKSFIQNIDAIIVVIWLCSVFIKLSLYTFITSYGTAQWLGIKNWKRVIWFVGIIGFILALIPKNIDVSSTDYPKNFWEPFVLPVNMVGIPILLWGIGKFRKNIESNKGKG